MADQDVQFDSLRIGGRQQPERVLLQIFFLKVH